MRAALSSIAPLLSTDYCLLLTCSAGPDGVEPAAGAALFADDLFELARVEPDAAAGVAAVYVDLVVGLGVELARAARAGHRDGLAAVLLRLLADGLAQAFERLLVLATEILLFEAAAAFVENV